MYAEKDYPTHLCLFSLRSGGHAAARASSRIARAASGRTVSVNQYNNNDWIAAFKQAFNDGDTVVVPPGSPAKTSIPAFSFPTVKRC
jgi:hypothetical protein